MVPNPPLECEIIFRGQLDPLWTGWFAGLSLEALPNGLTRLHGCLPDQAALQGVLGRVFDLNLGLVAVRIISE